jgi:gluconolactonase
MRHFTSVLVGALCLFASNKALAQDPFASPPKTEVRVAFVEGPVWHPSGNVFFTEIENNRIMRRDPAGNPHTYRTPAGRANGLAFDLQGRLVACEGGGEGGNRRVTRTEPNGTLTVLTDRFPDGGVTRRYNSPNDLVVDSDGRIYFTDPRYGPRGDIEMVDAAGGAIEGVYRIDPDGKVVRVLAGKSKEGVLQRPNGIEIAPDGKWLYVVDNQNSTPTGNRKVWRYPRAANGDVDATKGEAIIDFGDGRGGDGMAIDREGRLYIAAGTNFANPPTESGRNKAGIYVFGPDGKLVSLVPIPEDMITNCCFGGGGEQRAEDSKRPAVMPGFRPVNLPACGTVEPAVGRVGGAWRV